MSYSAVETFKDGFSCDFCILADEDFECTCLKPCGELVCKAKEEKK